MTAQELEKRLNADPRFQSLEGPSRVEKRKQIYEKLGVPLPQEQKTYKGDGPVHTYVRPALEALGMAGGGLIGSRLGPKGAAAGGALGYAGGEALASLAERLAGEKAPIQDLKQAGMETLEGVKTGGLMEMGGQIVGKVVAPILAPFAKQFEGENAAVRQAAEERGIKLDPHEVMQSRPLALGHKVLENVPFTSGMIQRAELEKLQGLTKEWQKLREKVGAPDRQRMGEIGGKIQDSIESHLDKIGIHQEEVRAEMREKIMQSMGSPVTYRDLGQQTQKAITDLYEAKKGIEKLAWDYAREAIPEGVRIENTNLRNAANKISKDYEGITSMLDEPILKQLKQIASSGNPKYDSLVSTIPAGLPDAVRAKLIKEITKDEQPGWNVQSLLKLRSALSDYASSHHSGLQRGDISKGSSDQYGRIYNELKNALDKDLEAYGEQAGSDIAQRFKIARGLSADRMAFFNPKENLYVMKAIQSEAETLDRHLIKPGNAAGFTQLRESIGDAGVQPVKQAFTNRLLGEGGKEAGGLAGLRNTLDRYGRQTLEEVYKPQEIEQLYNLADKSQWMKKNPVGNPFFREMVKSNPSQVAPAILSDVNTTAKTLRTFPEMKPHLRQAFVDGIHPNEKTPFPTRMIETLNAYPKEVQRQLFTGEELHEFHQLARIIERTRGTVKLAENPSGTAQNLVTFTTAGAILKHPLANAPQVLGTSAIAKLYLSKLGRKFLMEGIVTPSTSKLGAEIGTKIGAIMATDEYGTIKEKQKNPTRLTPVPFDDEE